MVKIAGTNCCASYGSPPLATILPAAQKQWKSTSSYQPLTPAAKKPQTSDNTTNSAAFPILRYNGFTRTESYSTRRGSGNGTMKRPR